MRKTSTDYRRELKELRQNTESLESHITDRLLQMIEKFPDSIVHIHGEVSMKAQHITKTWVLRQSIEEQLNYIQSIEEFNSKKERVRQTTIYD